MCSYAMLVAFFALLAGAGATALITGVQVLRQRHTLEPAALLPRFRALGVACAILSVLGTAVYVQAPTVANLFDVLLGTSIVVVAIYGAYRMQRLLVASASTASTRRTS